MTEVEDVLAHFGVRGMRWGVRTKGRTESISTPTSGPAPLAYRKRTKEGSAQPIVVEARAGQPIRTKGGKGHPTKEEAVVAAVLRQRAKSSGRQSLSNEDLRKVIERMNLEMQYSKLNPRKLSFGQKVTEEILFGSTPKIALESVKAIAEKTPAGEFVNPKTAKGIPIAAAIIANRPKRVKK